MASPRDIDVEQTARAAQGGDRSSLERLIGAVRPRVFRWAVVQTRSPDEAEDVAQEVATTLLGRLSDFRGGSFTAWLYRVTTNAAIDARRSWYRRRAVPWSDDADLAERPVQQDALDTLIGRELGDTLGRFLRELPRRQRELIDLIDVQGYSAVEAAQMLGIEAATARVHLLRARRALRRRLLEDAHDDV